MPFIVDALGWRVAILVCGVIAGAVFVSIWFLLPESPMFLADTGGDHSRLMKYCNAIEPGSATGHRTFERETDMHSKSYPIGALLTRDLRTGTLTLWIGYMAVMFTIYLTNTWLPYLFKEAGFGTGSISVLTTSLQIGGAVGCAAIGFIQDRIGLHRTLIWASVVGAGAAVAIAISPSATTMLGILVFALGMCTNAISTGYTAISTTFYPTAIRSTGTSWTAGMSRIGAVLGAGIGTSLASMGMTLQQVFLLMLAPITIGAVCMAIKGLTGRRNADVPDVQWMSAHLSTTGVNPTSDTTNGA